MKNVANCIFWNNTGLGDHASTNGLTRAISDITENPITSLNVNNCLDSLNFIEGSITSTTNTVTTNPLFVNTANRDYTLQSTSPAINAGDNSKVTLGITTDLAGNARIFNTTVDMGAYEFGAVLGVENNVFLKDFKLYPNPVNSIINIQLAETLEKVEVYSLLGRKVLENNTTEINVSNFSSGVYLLKVYTKNGRIGVKRFMKE